MSATEMIDISIDTEMLNASISMPALAGGSLPVLGSGKIEQFLNSKSQMLKLCNPVFSPFMLLQ